MKKLMLLLLITTILVLPLTLATPNSIWTSLNSCGAPSNSTVYHPGDKVYVNGEGFSQGFHRLGIRGLNSSCDSNQFIWGEFDLHMRENGSFCFNAVVITEDHCGEYEFVADNLISPYTIYQTEPPVVPEFGFLLAGLTIFASIGAFFLIRRK